MYDRDEFVRARIDNFLDEQRVRIQRVSTDSGIIAVRQAMQNGMTVGSFAASKREYKKFERDYFIESAPNDDGVARQLWLPAKIWVPLGTLRQREVVATSAEPSKRFDAWQATRPIIDDLEGYSEYEGEGKALFEEAKLTLHYLGANDDGFDMGVKEINL